MQLRRKFSKLHAVFQGRTSIIWLSFETGIKASLTLHAGACSMVLVYTYREFRRSSRSHNSQSKYTLPFREIVPCKLVLLLTPKVQLQHRERELLIDLKLLLTSFRYLFRAVLVTLPFQAPQITMDDLDKIVVSCTKLLFLPTPLGQADHINTQ